MGDSEGMAKGRKIKKLPIHDKPVFSSSSALIFIDLEHGNAGYLTSHLMFFAFCKKNLAIFKKLPSA